MTASGAPVPAAGGRPSAGTVGRLVETASAGLFDPVRCGLLLVVPGGWGSRELVEGILGRVAAPCLVVRGVPALHEVRFAAISPFLGDGIAPESLGSPLAVLHAFRAHCRAASDGGRLAVLVDNARSVDEASAAVLGQLTADPRFRLVVLCGDRDQLPGELRLLAADGQFAEVVVPELDVAEVAGSCAAALGGVVPRATAVSLWRLTGGNPALLDAAVEHEVSHGALRRRRGIWVTATRLDPGPAIRSALSAWLLGFDAAERSALEFAAVAHAVPRDVLVDRCGRGAVAALSAQRVLAPISPRHRDWLGVVPEMLARAVRASVSPVAVRQLWQEAGSALPEPADDRTLLRRSAWAAECGVVPGDDELAAVAAAAGRLGEPSAAARAAASMTGSAVGPSAAMLLAAEATAWAEASAGRPAEAVARLDALSAATDDASVHRVVAPALVRLGSVFRPGDPRLPAALSRWERAEGRSGDAARILAPRRLRRVLLVRRLLASGRYVDAAELLPDREPLSPGTHEEMLLLTMSAGEAVAMAGDVPRGTDILDSALAGARSREGPGHVTGAVVTRLCLLHAAAGDWDALDRLLEDVARLDAAWADRVGGTAELARGIRALQRGRTGEAAITLRAAVEVLRAADPDRLLPFAAAVAGYATWLSGGAEPPEPSRAGRGTRGGYAALRTLARALRRVTEHPAGEETSAALGSLVTRAASGGMMLVRVEILALDVLAGGGRPALERLRDATEDAATPRGRCLHRFARAALDGDGDVLLDAASFAADSGQERLAALCLAGALPRVRGASDQAARRRAAQILRGLDPDARRLHPALGEFGDAARLTRREAQVLEHVVLGRTTRQIADALGVSPRTVEGHVNRVMHKLGVARRTELRGLGDREPGAGPAA